jgi:hypothetical protein
MKKLFVFLASAIIILSFSSCNRYTSLGGGGCGAWGPRKFEKDRRMSKLTKVIATRNRWNSHY